MNNKDQHLEDIFKEALENHEMPFDASEWDKLEAQLDQKMPIKPSYNLNKWLIGGGIAAALIFGAVIVYNNDIDNNTQNNSKPLATNEQISNNSKENPQETSETVESTGIHSAENMDKNSSKEVNELKNDNNIQNNTVKESDELKKINSLENDPLISKTNDDENIDLNKSFELNENKGGKNNTSVKKDVPTPELTLLTPSEICQGESIHAEIKNNDKFTSIKWYFNDQMIGQEKEVRFTPANIGVGELSVVASTQKDSKSAMEVVEIKFNPSPEIEWRQPNPSVSEVELSHSLTGVNSKWYVNGELSEKTYESSVKIPFQDKGSYQVKLEVEQANGCKNSAEENIFIIEDFKLLAPSAFTPNGDNINDDFIPRSLEVMNKEFVMVIYNRNGKVIYQTQSIHEPWNGTLYNSGQKVPEGSYVWTVRFKEDQQTYQGVISLLR